MNRQEYNRLIINKLSELVEKYPNLRFGQILVNAKVIQTLSCDLAEDPYFEESEITWERIKK